MNKQSQKSYQLKENPRAAIFFQNHQEKIYKSTDRLFSILMPLQWGLAIALSLITAPFTWNGAESTINPHVWAAIILGGSITFLPVYLAIQCPGAAITRYTIAASQILMSSLLIHVTNGRIETHFHIFGSLAFLAFYRDWRVLIPATIVTAVDHIFRGWFFPHSIYGVLGNVEWRWLEHAAWVIFEDIFLIMLCRRSVAEMWETAVHTTALDDSETRYRAVVEQMTEGIFLLEPKTFKVIECNEAFARMIGYENAEEVKTLSAIDFDPAKPEELEFMTNLLERQKGSLDTERKYRRKDGSLIYVEIVGRSISYGEKMAFCVNVKDISDRKKTEAEVKRLALVAQKTQNAVIITNSEVEIEWVNEGFKTISGYEFDEVKGRRPFDFLHGIETSAETISEIKVHLKEQKPFSGEVYNYGKNGNGYWISVSIMPIHSKKGNLKGFIAVQTDITERKKMENALQMAHDDLEHRVAERTIELSQANEIMQKEVAERKRAENNLNAAKKFLDKVIDNVPNMIFVKDKAGRYVLANQSFASLFGTTVENVIGKKDKDLVGKPEDVEKYNLTDRQVLEQQREFVSQEEKFVDGEGLIHWLQIIKRPLAGDEGIEYILGIATDLTERKTLESQLRHAQKLESIGQLAAGIAHEINTPTQYVGDNVRFLSDGFDVFKTVLDKYDEMLCAAHRGNISSELLDEMDEKIEEADLAYFIEEVPSAVKQSLEGVARIAKIVQSMKDFAHPGTKEKKIVDLNKAIESTITVARNEWRYVADLELDLDENLPSVPCLLGEFNQVILNMVVNASHAIADVVGDGSQGKGKIVITTTRVNENWAEIRIADTGSGIPVEAQNHVFDPFFTTKDVGKGTGQGLAISHTVVVDKHSGKLNFETEPGKGTTFIIQLPLDADINSASEGLLR